MRKFVALICVAVCLAQAAFAQSHNPLEQLKAGDFRGVEDTYSTLQSQFERGTASEYDLLDAYKLFYQNGDLYRPDLDAWVTQFHSSSAYLARGVYFRKLGEFRRGTAYAEQVSNEDMAFMEKMFELAKRDLQTSLTLNPKSYLAVLHLLNIAQFEDDEPAARKYLELGNAILPTNLLVRARYLIHLTPKWGGSYQLMAAFIDRCRAEHLAPATINLLTAIKLDDEGHSAAEEGHIEIARANYAQALKLSQSAAPRFQRDYLQYSLNLCSAQQNGAVTHCR